MAKIKRMNPGYSGGIPLAVGDRYYAQDLGRDFHAGLDYLSTALRAITGFNSQLLRGGIVTKGTNFDEVNITAAFGTVAHVVTTPDDFSSLPPSTQSEDILATIVESEAQINFDITTGTLDGVTTNYVKLRYKETDGATRNRAKKSGSYVYEVEASYEIIVDTVAPTIYDIQLASFVGDGSTTLTITQTAPYFKYNVSAEDGDSINVGNCIDAVITVDVTLGDAAITLEDSESDQNNVHIIADGTGIVTISGTGLYANDIYITSNTGGARIKGDGINWSAINEVTADYVSGDFNVKITSLGKIVQDFYNSAVTTVTTALGSIFGSGAVTITFPITFMSEPVYKPGSYGFANICWNGVENAPTTTSMSIRLLSYQNSGTGRIVATLEGEY